MAQPNLFNQWLKSSSVSLWQWDIRHFVYIQKYLNQITAGTLKKLMIFLPPRHGKSEMCTIRYPVFRLDQLRTFRACVGCYNQRFAERFGRKSRRVARTRFDISQERSSSVEWETIEGGVYRSCGVGSPPMGEGFDLLLIDDPIKSREEAQSEAYRERVWEWYISDLYTRLEPGGSIILIMTRWHEDDLAARILASEDAPNWMVINLPAEAEENDPLGRQLGESLWPERFSKEALGSIRTVLGSYNYSSLYQQHPTPKEGGLFKRQYFKIVDAVPAGCVRVRWWDKAASENKGSDFTCGVLMAKSEEGRYYVEDVCRGQWSPNARNQIMLQTAQLDALKGDVRIWTEQEPGSGGLESAQITVRLMEGFPVRYERSTGTKEARADSFAAQCEAGNVSLVKANWNAKYLDELCSFPNGKNDDQVDGSSGAFNKLALIKRLETAIHV